MGSLNTHITPNKSAMPNDAIALIANFSDVSGTTSHTPNNIKMKLNVMPMKNMEANMIEIALASLILR